MSDRMKQQIEEVVEKNRRLLEEADAGRERRRDEIRRAQESLRRAQRLIRRAGGAAAS